MSNPLRTKTSLNKLTLGLGLCCSLSMGLFIWYKLRVVTGMPRSAIAVPPADGSAVQPPAPANAAVPAPASEKSEAQKQQENDEGMPQPR